MDCGGYMAALGTFDGVHRGHAFLLDELKSKASFVGLSPAVVTFSSHPLSTIRPERVPPLLTPLPRKLEMLEKSAKVIVLDFNEELRQLTALEFMRRLAGNYNIKAMMLGYDTRFGHDRPTEFADYVELGRLAGIDVTAAGEYAGPEAPVSSSRIRHLLADGDIAAANSLLGRRYSIAGTVCRGKQLGRTIGFPTANIEPESPQQLVPQPGVYAVFVKIDGDIALPAMLNIGTRPTVDNSPAPQRTIEAHILGFSGDIYGKQVEIEFVARLRDERRFGSLEELTKQLHSDAETAGNILTSAY